VIGGFLRWFDQWPQWLLQERWTVGVSLARIGFGSIVVCLYLVCMTQRALLFGSHGIESQPAYRAFIESAWGLNLFALPLGRVGDELLYFTGLLVAIFFTVGLLGRPVSIAFALFTWSLVHRCPGLMDGGWRLLCIMLVYFCFTNCNRRFSVDAWLRSKRGDPPPLEAVTMTHNAAVIICIVQLCIVYVFSAFYKVQGEPWQQGTALFYALSEREFSISPLSAMVASSPHLVALGTYSTLLFQSAFPWLLLHSRLRYVAVIVGTSFHVMIAILMGLQWFSAVMIVSELVILTDADYDAIHRFVDRVKAYGKVPALPTPAEAR
jgi:hypothetical protein